MQAKGGHRRAGRPARRDPRDDRPRRPLRPAGADPITCGCWRWPARITVVQRMLLVRRQALDGRLMPAASPDGRVGGLSRQATHGGVPRRAGALVRLLPEPAARAAFDRVADRCTARDGAQRAAAARQPRAASVPARRRLDQRHPGGGAVLPPLLVRVVPAAVLAHRRPRPAHPDGRGAAPAGRRTRPAAAWSPPCRTWATGTGPAPGPARTGMPLTTVAERLEPARLYDEFVDYRSGLGMEILPLTGGSAVATAMLDDWVREGRLVCLLADRDLSRTSVEVDAAGGAGPDAAGAGAARPRDRCALVPVTLPTGGATSSSPSTTPVPHAAGGDGLVAMMQGVADAFTPRIAADPQDWHMMQKVFTADLGPGARRHEDRASSAPTPSTPPAACRTTSRTSPRRSSPAATTSRCWRPSEDERPAAVRRRRPGAPSRCPTTVRWPGCPSARSSPRGCAAGSRRATSTSCTCTSRPRPSLVAAGAVGGGVPGRRDLPHLQRDRSRALSAVGRDPAARRWRRSPGGSRSPSMPATPWSRHIGGEPVVIPNGVYVDLYASAAAAGRTGAAREATVAFVGRLDEPRKGLPCSPRRSRRVAADRPGPAAARRGRRRHRRRRGPARRRVRDQVDVPRPGLATPTRRRCSRTADVYVAPNTGGESFGIVLVEAMAAGATVLASDLPAFAGCSTVAATASCSPPGTSTTSPARLRGLLDDPGRRAALDAAAAQAAFAATTGRPSPPGSSRSTRPSPRERADGLVLVRPGRPGGPGRSGSG